MTRRPSREPPSDSGSSFEWNEAKNRANVEKHGISFEEAQRAFDGPVLRRVDDRRDYGEERWLALGLVANDVCVVAYTMRAGKVRIISARKANRNEASAYTTRLGQAPPA